jgi:hypothetical protein
MKRTRPFIWAVAICFGAWSIAATAIALEFSDDFSSGPSPLWGNEVGAWSASGGVYSASAPGNFPNSHSSLPFELEDFALEVDINDVGDGGIWLRSTEAPASSIGIQGVLLVAKNSSIYWHVVPNGSTYGGILNDSGPEFSPGDDVRLRVEVTGDNYSVFVNGSATAATSLTSSLFPSGRVALYDFSPQTFDNVLLSAVPEPGTWALVAIGLMLRLRMRKRSQVVSLPD